MAGIYVHIPYCRQKCPYCNFFSLATSKHREDFPGLILRELDLTRDYPGKTNVETIYFGGGTPSLYPPRILENIIKEINIRYPFRHPSLTISQPHNLTSSRCEVTLELNPEDLTETYVRELRDTSFNRFSLGVQSFSDADLRYLDRPHSAEQSLRAVKMLREAGYGNISIDLIFGIPGTDDASWERTLETAFSLDVPHISAYALTVEERTPLAWRISRKKSAPTDDEQQVQQFRMLLRRMKENGYNQYEISNFCKPGMHAVHNTNYWNGIPYLGLGPSAHSYNGTSRRWNVSNLERYRAGIESGNPVFEEEVLTHEQRINEYIMTSLRTQWGCSEAWVKCEMRDADYGAFRRQADAFIEAGMMVRNESVLSLTEEGKLFADGIAGELFVEVAK